MPAPFEAPSAIILELDMTISLPAPPAPPIPALPWLIADIVEPSMFSELSVLPDPPPMPTPFWLCTVTLQSLTVILPE